MSNSDDESVNIVNNVNSNLEYETNTNENQKKRLA